MRLWLILDFVKYVLDFILTLDTNPKLSVSNAHLLEFMLMVLGLARGLCPDWSISKIHPVHVVKKENREVN